MAATTCEAAIPKHDVSFEWEFVWITALVHDGTFGGVVRELIHMMFGADFASASLTEWSQGEI